MATKIFHGGAAAVAQVSAATITGYDAGTTYRVTINGKVVSVVGTGGTAAATATALQAALAASTYAEFLEVTWTVNTATITGTAATAGVTFTATSSVSGGAGTFGAFSTSIASQGPNDLSTAANYAGGVVVGNGDDLIFASGCDDVFYGLDQSTLTTLASITWQPYCGKTGLPDWNAGGYREYREQYLRASATTVTIDGANCGRIKLDTGTNQTAVTVLRTGVSPDLATGVPAVLLKGTHVSNTLRVVSGTVGVAFYAGETAQFATITTVGGTTAVGSGVTLATATCNGGTLRLYGSVTAAYAAAGTTALYGSGTIGTLHPDGGSVQNKGNVTVSAVSFPDAPWTLSMVA